MPLSRFVNVRSWYLSLRLASSFALLAASTLASGQASDFTIVALPDTQNEAQYFPQVMSSQTQWIVDNQQALNIQAVLGEGDIVNDGADDVQMANADAAYRLLDQANVPYFAAIGNHDYDNFNPSGRPATGFNKWFGPDRYAAYPWYVGNYPSGSNENFYGILTIGGKDYLFLALEYVPRTSALDWAASVLSENLDKEAIVVTHSYMFWDNTRVDRCDTSDMARDNDGDETWQKLLSQYSNVIVVLSGHITGGQSARREDIGVNGNLVNQVFTNYQTFPDGGDGWLRIFTFHAATDTIDVTTYSPYLNKYRTDDANQFTLNWHKPDTSSLTTGTISGTVRDSACSNLAGVKVSAGGSSTTTDDSGRFSLALAQGGYTVSTNASGFEDSSTEVTVNNGFDVESNFYLNASSAPCTLSSVSPSVTICTPANNATVTSPVQVTAGTTDSHPVSFIQLYVDGKSTVTQQGGSLDTSATLSSGTHRLTVQAKDSLGTIFKQTIYVTESSSGTCTPNSVSPSVTICTPADNDTVSSPVQVTAVTTDNAHPVSFVQAYVDGVKALTQTGSKFDAALTMSAGRHRLTIQAKDSAAIIFKQTIYITVR